MRRIWYSRGESLSRRVVGCRRADRLASRSCISRAMRGAQTSSPMAAARTMQTRSSIDSFLVTKAAAPASAQASRSVSLCSTPNATTGRPPAAEYAILSESAGPSAPPQVVQSTRTTSKPANSLELEHYPNARNRFGIHNVRRPLLRRAGAG